MLSILFETIVKASKELFYYTITVVISFLATTISM